MAYTAALEYEAVRPRPRHCVAERRAPYPKRRLPESILHAAWRRAGRSGLVLKSSDGRSFRVLYPGRPAGGQGPDFVDAVVEAEDGSRLCGDIEIHVRSVDWKSHGHSRDSRYNGVLFHVALSDSGTEAFTSAGRAIPLLVMGALGTSHLQPQSGADEATRPALPVSFLDLGAAGDERFAHRSEGFAHEIRVLGADQTAYEGLLDCMGYPRNRAGFRRLARRLPWSQLDGDDAAESARTVRFVHLLLWAAGLGPKPSGSSALNGAPPEWSAQAGRPDNRPARRIEGASELLARMAASGGPAAYCVASVNSGESASLQESFGVPGGRERALIGSGRAAEIVVNLVLPFAHAVATLRRDRDLALRCVRLYRDHPALPENSLTREASVILSSRLEIPRKPGAREQQGMIHIYRMMTSRIVRSRQLPLV